MKLLIDDITEDPTTLEFVEPVEELDAQLHQGGTDWASQRPLDCELTHYRAGDDLIFNGRVRSQLTAVCARCAEEFDWPLDVPFDLVMSPRKREAREDGALGAEDLALGFYDGPEVDLSPLVCEQTLLALPTRPLCRDDCRGLCPNCGANMNTNPCNCPPATTAPRLGALHALLRDK